MQATIPLTWAEVEIASREVVPELLFLDEITPVSDAEWEKLRTYFQSHNPHLPGVAENRDS